MIAALNVTVHDAETTLDVLSGEYLPLLLQAAGAISADWARCQAVPQLAVASAPTVKEATGCSPTTT